MASWRENYLTSLKECDERRKSDFELIDAYTRLADQMAALEAKKAATTSLSIVAATNRDPAQALTTSEGTLQLKSDLAEALRAKGQLQSRLKATEGELDKLRQLSKSDSKLVRELSTHRGALIIKLKDRDQEIREKGKLLEEVHNETIALTLQLNMAEQRSEKLKKENEHLVQRWMARMGQEADDMNNASNFT